jgi:lipoprotein-anchoring transpeptidase ErfK/SrfK
MSPLENPPDQAIERARQALRRGERLEARRWAQAALAHSPEIEDAWLILAAVSSPQASVAHLKRALEINPASQRARRGMHWAIQRLRTEGKQLPKGRKAAPKPPAPPRRARKLPVLVMTGALLLTVCLLAAGAVAWVGYLQLGTFLADSVASGSALAGSAPTEGPSTVDPATPLADQFSATPAAANGTITPGAGNAALDTATPMQPMEPTATFTATPTPTDTPTPTPTFTPLPTHTPTQPPPTQAPINPPRAVRGDERWIDVDISEQRLYAYQGDQLVNSFLVSTGLWGTPTVQGRYRIYVKYRSQAMSGPGYYLPNVPFVMYFYKGYSFHGTYWHNNFGTPMSHGCVNMRTNEAKWLYNWASVGTLVNVHR